MSQKAPKFSAALRLSELMARARALAEDQAARRAETACLASLALLLALAACSPPPPPTPPPPMEHHHPGQWYESDSTD